MVPPRTEEPADGGRMEERRLQSDTMREGGGGKTED